MRKGFIYPVTMLVGVIIFAFCTKDIMGDLRSTTVSDGVISGLIWLGKHQNPDGSWGAKSFQNQCRVTKCKGTGDEQFNIGVTGLSLLAFTGAGYAQTAKDTYEGICFGEVVSKASSYLINIQLSDGTFGGVKDGKFMYNQAIATYALADLYALTLDSPGGVIYKEPVEKAVKYLISTQNSGKRYGGGWRYQPKDGQSDTSVTGWVTMALKAAEHCNISVPTGVFGNIKAYYNSATDPKNGAVGYTELGSIAIMVNEDPSKTVLQPSPTAIGILVRMLIDKKNTDPVIISGVKRIVSNLPTWDTSKPGMIDYYYWYYGSKCLDQYDGPSGENWKKWIEAMKTAMLKNQRTDSEECLKGSWDPIDRWSVEGGRVYSTAINTTILGFFNYYSVGDKKKK